MLKALGRHLEWSELPDRTRQLRKQLVTPRVAISDGDHFRTHIEEKNRMPLRLLNRDDYIEFVEVSYFGALRNGDCDGRARAFWAQDNTDSACQRLPASIMTRTPCAGELSLDDFMIAGSRLELTYLDFVHFVDPDQQRIASNFTLLFKPKQGGAGSEVPSSTNAEL